MAKVVDDYQVSLKLLLKNSKNEVLVLRCPETDGGYKYYYDFVGGRIDVDEFTKDLAHIINREVMEEVGYIQYRFKYKPVALGRHLVDVDGKTTKKGDHVMYVFFEADYLGGDITISPEHDEYRWVDLEKIELEKYFTSGILEGVKMYLGK